MKFLKLFFTIIILVGSQTLFAQSTYGYKLVWQDNFDGNSLDTTSWNNRVMKPGRVNNEKQRYTNGENVEVKDGKLIIEARYQNGEYTSGRINTKGKRTFTYGIVKMRAKLPAGVGTWPALWMLGENVSTVGWPACGELDIMEHVGKKPGFVHSSIHNPSGHGATPYTGIVEIQNPYSEFHIYSMEWTKDFITFYVDGRTIYHYQPQKKTLEDWPFDKPFFLIFNIAIGGNMGGPNIDSSCFPTDMAVDWVKVYQK
ncbi:MAG TPA: glycoside hydrolase family 16 protein [Sunxiuqinia sp.]|nr:glycoside hydrolase family 16 protein [Sunxiuqinia sp.]